MIDPQAQANKWMRKRGQHLAAQLEAAWKPAAPAKASAGGAVQNKAPPKIVNPFKVIKATHPKLLLLLEACIRNGHELVIENIGENLDPILEPVLQKAYFVNQGRIQIHLGDQDIDYDLNFRLSFTTKLANPHYLPEISIKVLLINFTVTPDGLEEQLLATVTGCSFSTDILICSGQFFPKLGFLNFEKCYSFLFGSLCKMDNF